MAAKRKTAKTASACKAAGGKPVHFKGMKKSEVVCFPKTSKSKKSASKKPASKKKSSTKKGTRKSASTFKKACKTMKAKGFTGKRKSFKKACSAVL